MNPRRLVISQLAALCFCAVACGSAFANSLSIARGDGLKNTLFSTTRLGLQTPCTARWKTLPGLCQYWDFSATLWEEGAFKRQPHLRSSESVHLIGLSPVMRYTFRPRERLSVYIEAGIGLVALDHNTLPLGSGDARELGAFWQFEDRIGVGMRFGRNKRLGFGLRVLHYSNLKLADPNEGVDAVLLTLEVELGRWGASDGRNR